MSNVLIGGYSFLSFEKLNYAQIYLFENILNPVIFFSGTPDDGAERNAAGGGYRWWQ